MKNLMKNIVFSLVLTLGIIGCAGSPTQESTGEYFDDSLVTTKVKSSLLADSRVRSKNISVETFKGTVQLSGFVDSKATAAIAVDITRRVKGVKAVNNSLVIIHP